LNSDHKDNSYRLMDEAIWREHLGWVFLGFSTFARKIACTWGKSLHSWLMRYQRHDFVRFSSEAQRIQANLEQAYVAWVDTKRALEAMPASMYWKTVNAVEYLAIKENSQSHGTTQGRRDAKTESRLTQHVEEKERLQQRIRTLDAQVSERAGLYRRLRLPSILDRQAEILRRLDVEGLLGEDLMVVGTNAFIAYELACGARFPTGNEETEDFDMAWCRGSGASLASTQVGDQRKSLFACLRSLDNSYTINPKKPYQAVNQDGYEVELLAAPSTHPLPVSEAFEPMATLVEQEWLLRGRPLNVVVATVRGRACPLYVPDPRWMALHKLWLNQKPERNPAKKAKDRRQGEVLLDAVHFFLEDTFPLDVDFLMELPDELRPFFNDWCSSRQVIPKN
jgi:hypothetical protein